jgi:DNA-binding CsgD family transcriptional regulator
VKSLLSPLTARDLRRAMAAVQALAADDADCVSFVRRALDELPRIVSSDLTTLSLCDLAAGTRTVVVRDGESLPERECAAFDRHFREHPLVRFHGSHPAGPTQRISDCVDGRRFRDSPVFSEYYRRIGISFVMALPLRTDEANVISIVFNRSRSDFTDRERAVLDALRHPLAALYRNLVAREEAGARLACLEELAVGEGWQVMKVEVDGRIAEITPPAMRLLQRFFDGGVRGRRPELPPALAGWLRRSRNWGLDHLASRDGDAFVIARDGTRLTVHFVPGAGGARGGYVLMKEERDEVRPLDLAALPLTAREREVLALVAGGKTNAEIGLILSISARTVQKHLEHVFAKIGVETRTAAAVCALAAAGADGSRPS